jgi:hypothetical protein
MNDSINLLTVDMYLTLISLDEIRVHSGNGATWLAIGRACAARYGDGKQACGAVPKLTPKSASAGATGSACCTPTRARPTAITRHWREAGVSVTQPDANVVSPSFVLKCRPFFACSSTFTAGPLDDGRLRSHAKRRGRARVQLQNGAGPQPGTRSTRALTGDKLPNSLTLSPQ